MRDAVRRDVVRSILAVAPEQRGANDTNVAKGADWNSSSRTIRQLFDAIRWIRFSLLSCLDGIGIQTVAELRRCTDVTTRYPSSAANTARYTTGKKVSFFTAQR